MPPIINPGRGHILGCKWGWGHTGCCCKDVFIHEGGGKAPSEGPRGAVRDVGIIEAVGQTWLGTTPPKIQENIS